MIPTLFDLRTGKTAKGDDRSVYWWTEGNGSCDCNRAEAFEGVAEEMWKQQHTDKPGLKEWQSLCYGCKRFIAIDVAGDLGYEDSDGDCRVPVTKEAILMAMNAEYGR